MTNSGARSRPTALPVRADPRPFSMLDELNCYFDSPAEPNNVHLEAWLSGHLQPDLLRSAVSATLAGLPAARARRAAGPWWHAGYTWEFPPETDADPVSISDWRTEAELDSARARFLAAAPALDRSPPLRLLLARGPEWDSLILNAHHAAFDGRSCLRLLYLIADRYGALRPPEAPADSAAPASAHPDPPRRAGTWPTAASTSAQTRLPVTARIAPQHEGGRMPGYGVAMLAWPGVPAVPGPPNEPGATVNDLLIAALAQTIIRWNAARHRRPERVRLTMPADTRPPGRGDELGNLSRLCTITVDPLRTARPADLIAYTAKQTRKAKSQPGPQVGPALAAVGRAPLPAPVKRGLVRLALRWLGPLACDTSLLSNLGNLTDLPGFGMLSPTRMWFSTSAHMPRGLSVGAVTADGRLALCFRYRRALFDDAAAGEFAAEYAAALATLSEPVGAGNRR